MSRARRTTSTRMVVAAVLAMVALTGCRITASTPPTTTAAGRTIETLTNGDGERFCSSFGRATRIAAAARSAAVSDPLLSTQNEMLASAALASELATLNAAAPDESKGGVERWIMRNNRALGALRQAGATSDVEAQLAVRVQSLPLGATGSLVEPLAVGLNVERLAAAASAFLRAEGSFDRVAPEINQQLGGRFTGEARSTALTTFPCLAALDTSG